MSWADETQTDQDKVSEMLAETDEKDLKSSDAEPSSELKSIEPKKVSDEEEQDTSWVKTPEPNEPEASLHLIRMKVKKTCLHKTFIYMTYLGAVIAFLMILGQFMAVYFFLMSPLQGILRCYIIAMCIVVILNELQWTQFIRESSILRVWITRGLFYAFIGVLGMIEVETEAPGKNMQAPGRDNCMMFIEVVSYMITGLGLLYYAMGCLCIEIVKNQVVADYEKRCAELSAAKKLGPTATAVPQIS